MIRLGVIHTYVHSACSISLILPLFNGFYSKELRLAERVRLTTGSCPRPLRGSPLRYESKNIILIFLSNSAQLSCDRPMHTQPSPTNNKGPRIRTSLYYLAERVRFELTSRLRDCRFSRPVLSATQPSLRGWASEFSFILRWLVSAPLRWAVAHLMAAAPSPPRLKKNSEAHNLDFRNYLMLRLLVPAPFRRLAHLTAAAPLPPFLREFLKSRI